jgi:hypothetical protein
MRSLAYEATDDGSGVVVMRGCQGEGGDVERGVGVCEIGHYDIYSISCYPTSADPSFTY